MSDLSKALGIDPTLSRNPAAEIAMMRGKSALTPEKMKQIESAAQDFEAMFATEMMKPMFESVQTDGEFDGGEAEDTWRGLMIDEYGKQIARNGGLGLSNDIKAKMIEMQEQAQAQGGVLK